MSLISNPTSYVTSQPKRAQRNGQESETAVCKLLGGTVIGKYKAEDIQHAKFSIEVKARTQYVGHRFMKQAITNCNSGKIPLLVIHLIGTNHSNDLVTIRLSDFVKLGVL